MTTAKTATQYRKAWKEHSRELWTMIHQAATNTEISADELLSKADAVFNGIDELIELAVKAGTWEKENEKA